MMMDGFLTFLIFGALFYVMMRFGCGAHMVHGRHEEHHPEGTPDNMHTDPVCGKHVDPEEGYGKMHGGRLYRFCSRQCLDAFDAEPDRYVNDKAEAPS